MSTKSGTCQWSNGRAVIPWAEGASEDALGAECTASGQGPSASRELNLEEDTQSFLPVIEEGWKGTWTSCVFVSFHDLSFLVPGWEWVGRLGMLVFLQMRKQMISELVYLGLMLAMSPSLTDPAVGN